MKKTWTEEDLQDLYDCAIGLEDLFLGQLIIQLGTNFRRLLTHLFSFRP